jgi:transcription elongation factor GreA
MHKQYLSKESFEELKKELEELKTTKRMEIAARLKQAKEYGDLSENSEYAEAREEQSAVETRIFDLEEILKNAAMITKHADSGIVEVGSTVTAKRGDKTITYTIVGSYEAKPEEGKISDESPLGKAFLKHKVGEKVMAATKTGGVEYEILKIE